MKHETIFKLRNFSEFKHSEYLLENSMVPLPVSAPHVSLLSHQHPLSQEGVINSWAPFHLNSCFHYDIRRFIMISLFPNECRFEKSVQFPETENTHYERLQHRIWCKSCLFFFKNAIIGDKRFVSHVGQTAVKQSVFKAEKTPFADLFL